MRKVFAGVVLVLLAATLAACERESSPSGLPVVHMQLGPEDFTLEVAATQFSRELGLMHRDSLPTDHGMLFVFTDEQPRSFWNHDVHFPLDLVFLNSSGEIVSLKHMDSFSEQTTPSDAAARYTIELNSGEAARLHLTTGEKLAVPDGLPRAEPGN